MNMLPFKSRWLLNTFLACSLILSACAHQEGAQGTDEDFLEGDSAYEDASGDFAGDESLDSAEDYVSVEGEDVEEDAEALGIPSDSEMAEESDSDDLDTNSEDSDEFLVDTGEANENQENFADEADDDFASLSIDVDDSQIDSEMDPMMGDSSILMSETDSEQSPELMSQQETTPKVASRPAPKRRPQVASRLPNVPSQPIQKNGERLNRYYLLRAEDTPEDLADLFFGSLERADDLQQWNQNQWKTGQMVYYVSPLQPADGEMRSFYEERGMIAKEYVVKRGDTLSTIAASEYGNPKSWTEIGVVNNIQHPDDLEAGMRLAIFPNDLSGYGLDLEKNRQAANHQESSLDNEINDLESEINSLENDLGKQVAAKSPQEGPLFRSVDAETLTQGGPRGSQLASVEVAGFVQRNLTLLLILGVLLIGSLFWLVFKRPKNTADF